ncbi:type II toxin-antitoxin system Phd/YefM family antitoxin [Nonomuraea ferruginea]
MPRSDHRSAGVLVSADMEGRHRFGWLILMGSDNLISMKVMTATEASRSFASVLDEAERGETIVVTRGGKQIAVIGPAPTAPGRMVKAFFWQAEPGRWTPISKLTWRRPARRSTAR